MGYLDWNSRFLQGYPQLDGQDWTAHGIPLDLSWRETDDSEPFIIPVASGEHVIQSIIADDAAADNPPRYIFEVPLQLIDEEVYFRLLRAKRKAEAVQFVPYLWDEDHFANQVNGDVRSLTRPVAWTVVAGVSSVTHPAIFYKDGVEDSDCAALSGTLSQVLTVAEDGDISVRYMPVFRVLVREVVGRVNDVNDGAITVTLEEVRRYA